MPTAGKDRQFFKIKPYLYEKTRPETIFRTRLLLRHYAYSICCFHWLAKIYGMKPKYFNNGRCRAIFDIDIDFGASLSTVRIQLLVRHSYLRGFVWFYKWHEIGEFYFNPFTDSEEKFFSGIDKVFDERKEARRKIRRYEKMNTLKIIQA